ncbi:MAG: hypothetical protein WDM77_14650 [Steroidobacteraceae bacterium]
MTEEIVTALTRIRALFVISGESSLALKGQNLADQHAAAVRLGVRYVLEGSVRRCDDRVRIAVNLIDTGKGAQIWAGRFDETLKDIFDLQDRIALRVAGVIEPSVYAAELHRVARHPIENLGCYDLYLRAAWLRATCRKAEVVQALKLLDRALDLDPDCAPALARRPVATARCTPMAGARTGSGTGGRDWPWPSGRSRQDLKMPRCLRRWPMR